MKKSLLSIFLVICLMIGAVPSSAWAKSSEVGKSQTGAYGSFTNGSQVISDMIERNGQGAHPRIIMTDAKFEKLKSHKDDKSVTSILLGKLQGEANRLLNSPVAEYDISDGIRLLETSKRMQRRIAALALAYNIFGDEKYAKRCYQEMEAACNFKDWNPSHFLDPAEMSTGLALGYDWLYNWMDEEKRTFIRTNLIEKGLNQVMEDYEDKTRTRTYKWYQDYPGDNWKLVCTGGMNLAALAIGDEEDAKEISAAVLTYGYKEAYSFVRRAYSIKDGTYSEGLGYWDYATYYLGLQSSALMSATGTDYGLADYEGLRKSVDFVRYMSSNTPKSFSFGDDRESRDTGWAVFQWLGEYFKSPELAAIRLKKIEGDSFNYLDVLWIDEDSQTGVGAAGSTDWGVVGASNASFRNTWDESGIVTALHAGENNYKYHGHYDLGSFYIEANGARFFTDLGNENYELKDRQYSYRIRAEGHNTLVINPSKTLDQREGAECLITDFRGGNNAYAVADLTDAYGDSGAQRVIRGLKMIKDKECVVVQDEITLNAPGEIYWFAHTTGQLDIASDGRSAIVTVGSDRLWVGLLSEEGSFCAMKAEPLSTSPVVANITDNSSYRKLAIHLTNTKSTTISVACIPLKKGQTSPSWTPTMQTISEWACGGETGHKFEDQGNGKHRCTVCGKTEEHVLKTTTTKATLTDNGRSETKCEICGKVTNNTTIYYPKSISLSKTSYVYDGEEHKPTVTVTDSSGKNIPATNYSVTYTDIEGTESAPSVNVGAYQVKVVFKGNYQGSVFKTYKILPQTTRIGTPANSSNAITVKWSENSSVTGYYIYRSVDGAAYKKVKTIANNATVSWKDTGAKTNGAKYRYKIVAYKTVGEKIYRSADSKGKTIYFLKKPAIESLTNSDMKKMTVKWNGNTEGTGYQIQYSLKSDFSDVKSVTVKSNSTVSKSIGRLLKGKTYYVRIRTVKAVGSTKYYSAWSAKKYVKITK